MMLKQLIGKFELHPKRLFLIDGLGAMLSAFLLGVILVKFERFFGIPSSTLYFLASLPIGFMIYDFYSYQKETGTESKLLKGISITNILYCLLSLALSFYHFKTVTTLGWLYILVEILIILFLARIQYSVAQKLISNRTTG